MMREQAIRLVALVVLLNACVSDTTQPTVTSTLGTVAAAAVRPSGLFASELVEFDTCHAFLGAC